MLTYADVCCIGWSAQEAYGGYSADVASLVAAGQGVGAGGAVEGPGLHAAPDISEGDAPADAA
jgi:hypothetical protein